LSTRPDFSAILSSPSHKDMTPMSPIRQRDRVAGAFQRSGADRLHVAAHRSGDERREQQQDEDDVHRARAWHENAVPTICLPTREPFGDCPRVARDCSP